MYERKGSWCILDSLQSLETVVSSFAPLRAYAHPKLPNWIVSKRAVTSVKSPGFDSTIKNFSRLVRSQVTPHDNQHFFCYSCLHGFIREDLLTSHVQHCRVESAQRTKMPENDPTLKFTNVQKQPKAPFAAYADFECILQQHQQVDGTDVNTHTYIKKVSQNSNTQVFQEYIPCSFAFKVTSIDPDHNPEIVVYKGEDPADQFIETLRKHLISTIITSRIQNQ